jgi:UDP-glucose 4-epimerase
MQHRSALVTGGAGFIGSHLTDHLLDDGWQVTVLDDLSTGRLANLEPARTGPCGDRLSLVRGSVTDEALVGRLTAEADVVFHLAAAVGVFTIQSDPLGSLRTNVHGTEIVVEAAHRAGARLLVTSTSEVYGKNTRPGLREDDDRVMGSPLKSRWSYAEAKALDETVTSQYALHRGLRAVIVRLFNTTGPRQSGRYGMVVPRLVQQALAGEPLTVYGSGEQTRCFAHVADIVPALVALVDCDAAIATAVNLGNPEQVSINDLAGRVLARTGSSSPVRHVSYEEAYGQGYEDMERRVPDCTRAQELIGFRPARGLEDVLDALIAEHRGRAPRQTAGA